MIMEIQQSLLTREDNLMMAINYVTAQEDTFFTIRELKTETRTGDFNTRLQLRYVMSHDVVMIERTVFNFFTLLGDIGGFYGLLGSIFATIHGILNYNKTENYIVQQLYRSERSKSDAPSNDDDQLR